MTIAYRAGSTAGNASGGNLTVNKPTGTAENDILVVALYKEAGTWTLPSGWTQVATQNNWDNQMNLTMAWKRAGASEGSSYTFTLSTTTWRIAAVAAFSGCLTSGDAVDVYAANGGAEFDETPDASSITTTVADTMRVCGIGNYIGADVGIGSTGFTQGAELGGTELFYAAQASAGSSGVKTFPTISDDTWVTIHLALKPAASGLSATANQTTETDTAQAVGKAKAKATGQPSETETAQVIAAAKALAISQTSETDAVQAIARLKTVPVGQVSETDAAQTITRVKAAAINQVSETATSQALTSLKTGLVAQVEETDTAQPISQPGAIVQAVGQVVESDTVQVLVVLKLKSIGQASTSAAAQTLTVVKARTISQAAEVESSQALTARKSAVVGQVSELETALVVTVARVYPVGQAIESSTAQPVTRLKVHPLNQVIEVDIAAALIVAGGILAIYEVSLRCNPSPTGDLFTNPSPAVELRCNPSPTEEIFSG